MDLATSNVYLNIPIRSKIGAIPFNASFALNSHIFIGQNIIDNITTHYIGISAPNALPIVDGFFRVTSALISTNPCIQYAFYGVSDGNGTLHGFSGNNGTITPICGVTPSPTFTADGEYLVTWSTPSLASAVRKDGLSSNVTTVTDPDGHSISHSSSGGTTTYTDTLSQTALTINGSGTPSYTDASGNSQSFTVTDTSYTPYTAFGCASVGDMSGTAAMALPTTITTPTLATYAISYESTKSGTGAYGPYTSGRIAKITYPSGGYIAYTYSGGNSGFQCTSQVVPTLKVEINDNNGNDGKYWTFVNSNTSPLPQYPGLPTGNYTVTETDPAGNQTVYTFAGEYQTQAVYYQGTSTVLKTVTTCYNGTAFANCAAAINVGSSFTETDVYTSLGTSATNRVQTKFDAYGNITYVGNYDFGASTPTTQAVNVYGQSYSTPTACNPYPSGTNIYNTPCYAHTQNSAGTDLAETKISYNADGHPASVSRWTGVATNTWLTTSMAYGAIGASAGILSSMTEPNTAVTTFTSFECNGMLPSATTYPLASVGSDSQTWDCNGGVRTGYTDVNGKLTTYSYTANGADPLYRLKSVTNPDGGVVTYSYNTGSVLPWTTTVSTAIGPGQPTITSITALDGLGRAVLASGSTHSSSTDPNASGQLRYGGAVYNNLGQVVKQYNPYFTSSDQTYGYTAFSFDALGRTTQVQHPSGITETYTYTKRAIEHILYPSNNAITKIFQRDGLGRLTNVCEVTSVTQANGVAPVSCGLDISGTGFPATITYDALGNVLTMAAGSNRTFVYDGLSRPTSTTYPESGTTTYVYDTGTPGDLYQRIAPAPNQTGSTTVTSTYTHDALHRLTGISYSDGTTPAVAYNYDQSSVWSHTLTNPKGRMTSAAVGSGEITSVFGYDPIGRVALHGQCTPLNCGTTNFFANYTYNYIGEPSGGTDYLGITWTNTYNALGQLSEVTTNWLSPTQSGTIASGLTYNALGQPVSDTLGDGKNEGWNYNVDGHVTTFSGGSYPGYNFGFSPSSLTWTGDLLTSSSDNVNGSWTYTYDDFARLKSASGSQDFVYGYDQYANRWSTMTGTQQYSFNGVNNHITTNGFAYDAAGNMTNDGIHSYTYDAEGRLKAVDSGNTAKYNYDAFGNRTMQFSTTPSVYNEYVVDLSGRAITAIQPGTTNVYTAEVFAGGRHWVTDNGSALFLGADWLGTTRALTNLSGTFDQLYTSLPWGDGLSSGGSSFDTTSQYTGKEYDPESGLYHFPARQYAPVQGRWLTPDPAGISAMSLDSPQSWNRYAYVLNNPLSNTDPLGLDCVHIDNTTGEYEGTTIGDCDNATEDSANSEYYFDGTVNQNPNLISVDGYGNVSAVVDGQLGCSGDANCAIYNSLTTVNVNGGSGNSINCQAPFLCNTMSISADHRDWFQRTGDRINNWIMRSKGVAVFVCLTNPQGANDIADLGAQVNEHTDEMPEGAGGTAIWVVNINSAKNGGQSPYGNESAATKANGAALGFEHASAAFGCLGR